MLSLPSVGWLCFAVGNLLCCWESKGSSRLPTTASSLQHFLSSKLPHGCSLELSRAYLHTCNGLESEWQMKKETKHLHNHWHTKWIFLFFFNVRRHGFGFFFKFGWIFFLFHAFTHVWHSFINMPMNGTSLHNYCYYYYCCYFCLLSTYTTLIALIILLEVSLIFFLFQDFLVFLIQIERFFLCCTYCWAF